ncbi:hypothetical protein ESCO_006045 [Escovopsis weberi]|uniref:Uncharacterized protein n=1 Tax=Escovopsis weberi TaxID=150374 RepID=A0A0M8MYT6_ESCWE|nr:hypothetical protein ESCO_006045 [Escovopsis weberi]
MHSNRPHKLLEQVPLTVSPFVSLPTAPTLSYNYKTLPSNIPPSALGIPTASDDPASQPKPRYVVSSSGHAAHPEDIIASCRALQAHVTKMQEDADQELRQLEERIRERELAEKRRLAPGWLDSDARLLKPERSATTPNEQQQQQQQQHGIPGIASPMDIDSRDASGDQGAQLDRAFGGMALQ